jgi:flavin reductase (DIM6/NTAB) family NADH-FMN oxidoreductase RutF
MYYEPGNGPHGLPFDPFKSCVVPRPIGWISTIGVDGVGNLAPYSQFNNVTFDPPTILFVANHAIDGRQKDSVANAEAIGEFVWNMATYSLRDAVNRSAQAVPPEIDEFDLAGVTRAPSRLVRPPRVKESPIQFECRFLQRVAIPGNGQMGSADIVIGRVVAIHTADEAIDGNGRIDVLKLRPLARMGYHDYTTVDSTFEMIIPGNDRGLLRGLAGTPSNAQPED